MGFDIVIGQIDERKLNNLRKSKDYRENAYSSTVAKLEYNSRAPSVISNLPPNYHPKKTKHNKTGYNFGFTEKMSERYPSMREFWNLGRYAYPGETGGQEFIAFLGRNQIGNIINFNVTSYDLVLLYQKIRMDVKRAHDAQDTDGSYMLDYIDFWWYLALSKYKQGAVADVS